MSAAPQALLAELARLCALAHSALPGEAVPCFAHLRIAPQGFAAEPGGSRVRDLLLGWRTLSNAQVTLLHWQTAPLSQVFFTTRVGEEYELEVGDKVLCGTVLSRSLLSFHAGELHEVQTQDGVYTRHGGAWVHAGAPSPLLRPCQRGALRAPPPWSREALDPEQRRAVERPPGRPLLVLGEAGCGKTTVALHRVAALREAAKQAGQRFRGLVLVPAASAGLRHLSTTLLARLGATDVEVEVFDRWAGRQARKAFASLPERESQDGSAGVVALKRHPALLSALAEFAGKKGRRGSGKKGAGASRADLLRLFGDQVFLERVAAAAGGAISAEAIKQVLLHTKVQFWATTEQSSTHIDAERLVTVDGLRIDQGTPMEDAGSIDPEDYAVLFALAELRAAPGAAGPMPTQYDCVVIDEAQELSPIELRLVGRALAASGSLIVAGDEAQQVDPTAYFESFGGAMQALQAGEYQTVQLAVSYRCPPAVTALARTLRGAAGPPAAAPAADEAVVQVRFDNECHLVARLIDALQDLRAVDAQATAAVICRTPQTAERLARLLSRGVDARLARDGEFRFASPVEVTCVAEIKGLEFDYVIVPDAAAAVYPDDAPARRALYVALTRTAQQLLLTCTGTATSLLPRA